MVREAREALGDRGAHALPAEAEAAERALIERTTPGLKAFAALAEATTDPASPIIKLASPLDWSHAVDVAQLVELLVVVQAVAGSNPVVHL